LNVAGTRAAVDVAVVTWNTADLTPSLLRHLLDRDQGCDLHLLVRDNGSSDGTIEAIRAAVPEADIDPGEENLGFAAGVNRILERSSAPWIFLLNSDAWPEPGAIGRLVEVARNHPGAAAVVPRIERPDGALEHSTHPFPSLRVAAIMAFAPRRIGARRGDRLLLEGAWMHDRPREVDWAVGAAMLLRREAVDDAGGLDERFFMYVEDLEWCWRAKRRGWQIRFEPSAIVRHVGNASGAKRYGEDRTRAYLGNTYRFYRREHGMVSEGLFRALNLVGAGLRYASARRSRDSDRIRYWRAHLYAHLAPAGAVDPYAPERR